ncbi:MAG: putative metallopeptidase, partial [Aggregatilineales bacterium]
MLAPDGPLSNYDHAHLHDHEARVAFAWSSVVLSKGGRRVLGRCALGAPTGDRWQQAWKREQLLRLFGEEPTFVVTLDARFVSHALRTDRVADVLALVEHELYHAGIECD